MNNCVVAGNYTVKDNSAVSSDMIVGYALNSSVSGFPALNEVFAKVEPRTVNGVSIWLHLGKH